MYADRDSIKAFEREFARERMAEEARDLDQTYDSDLVSEHFQSASREWTAILFVVAACLLAAAAAFTL